MAPTVDLDGLIKDIQKEFPGFEIRFKDESFLQKIIHYFLMIITFGGQREYLTRYHTQMGLKMYVPSRATWESKSEQDRWATMIHEREHLRQNRRHGSIKMSFLYIFWAPAFYNPFRRKCEQEGYEKTIAAKVLLEGAEAARDKEFQDFIALQFYSPAYAWMWTKGQAERWVAETVERAIRGEISLD